MGEVKRISISLKVDTGDETYWSLIEPLQNNRQLSTFIITCLKAYVEDSDIHDAIDMYNRKGSGVDKIREHIENLMKLQAKANRTAEDINSSLGGDTEELEIENMFDDEVDEPENDEEDNMSTQAEQTSRTSVKSVKTAAANSAAALPESIDTGALNKIIKRLDSLEQTVGSLSSRVGVNAEHISKIEGYKKESEPAVKVAKGKTKTEQAKTSATSATKAPANGSSVAKVPVTDVKKPEPIKEVRFDDIPETTGVKEQTNDGGMDFSDLLTGFMDSVQ